MIIIWRSLACHWRGHLASFRGAHFERASPALVEKLEPLDDPFGRLGTLSASELCSLVRSMLYSRREVPRKTFEGMVANLWSLHADGMGSLKRVDIDTMGHPHGPHDRMNIPDTTSIILDIIMSILLLGAEIGESAFSSLLAILDASRATTEPNHQLKILDIAYTIACFYPDMQRLYTPQLSNYFDYLKLVAPEIRLQCLHFPESQEALEIKNVLSDMRVNFSSAITGLFVNSQQEEQVTCTLQWYSRGTT